jgi:hypothetical protein
MIRICERLSTAPESVARKSGAIVVFGAYEYFDLTGTARRARSTAAGRRARPAT